jgi:single-strand DNA-binding protein
MSYSVNKVILLGNVGKDPDIRTTPSGITVANFSIATSKRVKDASGNWNEKTEWHNLVAFSRRAEVIRDYVRKGSKVYIEGELQTRSWDDRQTGEKKYKTQVEIYTLILLGGNNERQSNSNYQPENNSYRQDSYSRQTRSEPFVSDEITDDDIPF